MRQLQKKTFRASLLSELIFVYLHILAKPLKTTFNLMEQRP